jgi:hypothetical protein
LPAPKAWADITFCCRIWRHALGGQCAVAPGSGTLPVLNYV